MVRFNPLSLGYDSYRVVVIYKCIVIKHEQGMDISRRSTESTCYMSSLVTPCLHVCTSMYGTTDLSRTVVIFQTPCATTITTTTTTTTTLDALMGAIRNPASMNIATTTTTTTTTNYTTATTASHTRVYVRTRRSSCAPSTPCSIEMP